MRGILSDRKSDFPFAFSARGPAGEGIGDRLFAAFVMLAAISWLTVDHGERCRPAAVTAVEQASLEFDNLSAGVCTPRLATVHRKPISCEISVHIERATDGSFAMSLGLPSEARQCVTGTGGAEALANFVNELGRLCAVFDDPEIVPENAIRAGKRSGSGF